MSTRRSKQAKKRRNKKVRRNGQSKVLVSTIGSDRIPRALKGAAPFPMSDIRRVSLQSNYQLAAAAPFFVKSYRANDVWDPDTALGGGNVTGHAQLMAIYNFYHVQKISWKFTISSNEPAVSVNFYSIVRDVNPATTITSWGEAQEQAVQAPTTGSQVVGEASGQSLYRSPWFHLDLASVLGNPFNYYGEDNWASTTNTDPTNILWLSFVAFSQASGNNLTNGVFLNLTIVFTTRYYSLKNFEPTLRAERHAKQALKGN